MMLRMSSIDERIVAALHDVCEDKDGRLIDSAGRVFPSASRRWRVLTNHALAQGMCESVILIRYETCRPSLPTAPVGLVWGPLTNVIGSEAAITAKGQARHSRTAASAMEPDHVL
jgi:hypothetical protein